MGMTLPPKSKGSDERTRDAMGQMHSLCCVFKTMRTENTSNPFVCKLPLVGSESRYDVHTLIQTSPGTQDFQRSGNESPCEVEVIGEDPRTSHTISSLYMIETLLF